MKEVASAALTNAPTIDCSAVPASVEEMVQPAIDLYDKLIEINLEDAQFDIKKMYETSLTNKRKSQGIIEHVQVCHGTCAENL